MKADTSKWRVEEQQGETQRVLVVEATSWEAALQSAWANWERPHDLRRAGVEVGLSATQVFIRGTSQRYRISLERPPTKRAVPRPASSVPPPMPAEAIDSATPAGPAATQLAPSTLEPKVEPKKPDPKKPDPKKQPLNKKGEALPSGRSLFGKLPRPSSPDLEDFARPAPRASQPDREEANATASEPQLPAAPRAPALKVATPPPLPKSELASAGGNATPRVESEPRVAAASPSIVPTPVVDIGASARPPPPDPAAPAPSPSPAAAAPARPAVAAPAAPARALPKVDPRRLQVLVSGAVQLYTREQDPKNGAPVIYRQYGYALPMGTEEEEGEAFGRWMLLQLQRQVPAGSAPRLFHLAVYDEMFTGDPPILALCKLEWKEWKDQTNVSFPRRGDDSVVAVPPRARTPSMHPDMVAPAPAPGSPGSQTVKAAGRVAALFLPPVTPPSFAVQPAPDASPTSATEPAADRASRSSSSSEK